MLKVRTILHPTDFSDCSKAAFSWAVFLARELEAELQMLHVMVPTGASVIELTSRFPTGEEILEELRRTAQAELSELAKSEAGTLLRVHDMIRHGHQAAPTILEHAVEEDVDLIVLGTHGRRPAARFLMGSVAQEVVRRAPCPVVCVRMPEQPAEAPAIRNVLAPLDLVDEDPEAMSLATEMATRFDATLWLLHVVDERAWQGEIDSGPVEDVISQREDLEAVACARLGRCLSASAYGGKVEIRAEIGRPPEAILRFVREQGIDLVVMKTHGKGGLAEVLLGSTTERVLRLASCPVLALHPAAKVPTGS